jgi:hypothetical protein
MLQFVTADVTCKWLQAKQRVIRVDGLSFNAPSQIMFIETI